MQPEILYILTALVIILLICLLISFISNKQKNIIDLSENENYNILIDTPKGLIKTTNQKAIVELEFIKNQLLHRKHLINNSCSDLKPLIQDAMRHLHKFISENPKMNSEALCKLELRNNIINEIMERTIEPDNNWETEYKTLLDWEETERRMSTNICELLIFLIKNIDITIAMMRSEICDFGRIDLNKLYHLLLKINDTVGMHGTINIEYFKEDKELNKTKNATYIELTELPETDIRTNMEKGLPSRESFGSVKYYDMSNNEDLTQVISSNRLLDNSFEGNVEKDILGYKPPGHIISQLYDKSDHFTTNVNSCLGKTVSDDKLWEQCTQFDIRPMMALQGHANGLIVHYE